MPGTVLNFYKSAHKFLTATVVATALAVTGGSANASNPGSGKGLIQLPVGEMTKLTYIGEEYHIDNNQNGIPDEGDVMTGIAIITDIEGYESEQSYSHQLKTREITVVFQFTITAGSMADGHIDFSLVEGDFFRLYVGVGNRKNYNPLASNAWDRAADGHPWISMESGTFFESVNDFQPDYTTRNRAWADLTSNGTRYSFLHTLFPTRLGLDPSHVFDGQPRGDLPSQLYFENFIDGFSANPDYTYAIRGHFFVEAAP